MYVCPCVRFSIGGRAPQARIRRCTGARNDYIVANQGAAGMGWEGCVRRKCSYSSKSGRRRHGLGRVAGAKKFLWQQMRAPQARVLSCVRRKCFYSGKPGGRRHGLGGLLAQEKLIRLQIRATQARTGNYNIVETFTVNTVFFI